MPVPGHGHVYPEGHRFLWPVGRWRSGHGPTSVTKRGKKNIDIVNTQNVPAGLLGIAISGGHRLRLEPCDYSMRDVLSVREDGGRRGRDVQSFTKSTNCCFHAMAR